MLEHTVTDSLKAIVSETTDEELVEIFNAIQWELSKRSLPFAGKEFYQALGVTTLINQAAEDYQIALALGTTPPGPGPYYDASLDYKGNLDKICNLLKKNPHDDELFLVLKKDLAYAMGK